MAPVNVSEIGYQAFRFLLDFDFRRMFLKADLIVIGDRHFLELGSYRDFKVVKLADLLNLMGRF